MGPRSAVFLPDAFSHLGGTAFGATAYDAVHDTFMTLSPYTRISEGEVQELGLGVRNCSHSALSDPLSEQSERIERACEATSAEGTARCASRGLLGPGVGENQRKHWRKAEQILRRNMPFTATSRND